MSVTNVLEFCVIAALGPTNRLEVRSAVCPHIPWLDSDETVWPSVRAALEAPLRDSLAGVSNSGPAALEKAIGASASELQELLARDFRIVTELQLKLCIEEHAPGVVNAIIAGLPETARQPVADFFANGRVTWQPFDAVAERQSIQLTKHDLKIADSTVTIMPGVRSRVMLSTRRSFFLRGLRVKADKIRVEANESRALPEGSSEVPLPEIPVSDYPLLNRMRGKLGLECLVGSKARTMPLLSLRFSLPAIERSPVATFIDMGSTMTKFLTVAISTDPLPFPPDNGWNEQLRHDLNRAISEQGQKLGIASIAIPECTMDFVSARGMPGFDKAKLDELGDEALCAWFESAIYGLARSVAHSKQRLLSHVYWSFPNTRERDFTRLNKELNRRAGHAVLDRIVIAPEHDCLRLRFGRILHFLAMRAQQQQHEEAAVQQYNRDVETKQSVAIANYNQQIVAYANRWAVTRWFVAAPEPPDDSQFRKKEAPTLAEWVEPFRHINADETLSEVLIIDAGGYSLDVFGLIDSQSFARSFKAGGTLLTDGLRQCIAEAGRRDISWGEAEGRKCFLCSTTKPEDEEKWPEMRRCRELTQEIYDPPLTEIATWIAQRSMSRGVPVILTGGAMANRFLRERIPGILQTHGIRSHTTDAVELATLLSENGGKDIELFNAISRAFSAQPPVPWYDVLGGLAQHAAGDM